MNFRCLLCASIVLRLHLVVISSIEERPDAQLGLELMTPYVGARSRCRHCCFGQLTMLLSTRHKTGIALVPTSISPRRPLDLSYQEGHSTSCFAGRADIFCLNEDCLIRTWCPESFTRSQPFFATTSLTSCSHCHRHGSNVHEGTDQPFTRWTCTSVSYSVHTFRL